MKVSKFYFPLLAAAMFASCSSEAIDGPNKPGSEVENACYMQVSLNLVSPNGTRAFNEGDEPTEIGKDYENAIKKAIIVLASPGKVVDGKMVDKHRLIAAVEVSNLVGTSAIHNVTAKFTQSDLENYRDIIGEGSKDIEVYALCNYPGDPKSLTNLKWGNANTEWINDYSEYINNSALLVDGVKSTGVFMTSDEISSAILPDKDVLAASSPTNPVNLGKIKVSRALARFDYADGSEGDGIYTVYNAADDNEIEDDNTSKIQVKIVKVAAINISKNFYNFKHLAADNNGKVDVDNASAFEPGTVLVDYNAAEKTKSNGESKDWISLNYMNSLFTGTKTEEGNWTLNRSGWNPDDHTALLNGADDEWNNKNNDTKNRNYKIWRYVTENIIPVANNQMNGVSTGIVFKGEITVPDGGGKVAEQFRNAMAAKKTLYVFASSNSKAAAIGSLQDIVALGKDHNIYSVMSNCLNDGKKMTDADLSDADVDKAKATAAGFTMYEAAKGGNIGDGALANGDVEGKYYMYFYYWNRHDDNGDNSKMGQNEFATVRNHVYKLCLTKINRFGHPRKSINDPDPEEPGKPDEDENAYISVSLEIIPWGVRVNDIEF